MLQAFSACATLVCTSGRESGWKSVWESCPKSGGASEQLPTTCLRSGSDSQVLLLLQRAFLRVAKMVKSGKLGTSDGEMANSGKIRYF